MQQIELLVNGVPDNNYVSKRSAEYRGKVSNQSERATTLVSTRATQVVADNEERR